MKKIKIFLHVTLDGFVAGPTGEMDWISLDDSQFEFIGKMVGDADTYLMGRVTYQMMESYWPTAGDQPNASRHDIEHSRWYNQVSKVVISGTLKETNAQGPRVIGRDLKNEVETLKRQPGTDIVIFGSPRAAHSLMHLDLIDEYGLFVNPVVLGKGVPTFADITTRLDLKLSTTRTFATGVIFLHYARK
jgi:dihydrofolate reductase